MTSTLCESAPASQYAQRVMQTYQQMLANGWRVVPFRRDKAGNSKPSIKYAEAKDNPQKACGIIFGGCDGLLLDVASLKNGVVIDFDDTATYKQWTEAHPDLASVCPTVKTQRGFHVYAKLATIDIPKQYRVPGQPIDVMFGKGSVVLPPSIGKDGRTEYIWTNDNREMPTINDISDILPPSLLTSGTGGIKYLEDLKELSYLSTGMAVDTPENHWPNARNTAEPSLLAASTSWFEQHPSLVAISVLDAAGELGAYLTRTLPQSTGTRNKQLLKLVMLLRRVAPTASARDLDDLVVAWLDVAMRRKTTTAFEPDPTLREFEQCWIRYDPTKASDIGKAFANMNANATFNYDPSRLSSVRNHFPYRRLWAYCKTASTITDEPFPMAVSVVEDICFQPESKDAWQYIEKLCSSGILEKVTVGTRGKRKGGTPSCYRYIGG